MEDKTKTPDQDLTTSIKLSKSASASINIQDKFTKVITVMFTIKGSTALAETQEDFTIRTVIKRHNEILSRSSRNTTGPW